MNWLFFFFFYFHTGPMEDKIKSYKAKWQQMNNLRFLTQKNKEIKIDKCKKCWKGANEHLDSGKAKNSICLKLLRKNSWQRWKQISILKESQDLDQVESRRNFRPAQCHLTLIQTAPPARGLKCMYLLCRQQVDDCIKNQFSPRRICH